MADADHSTSANPAPTAQRRISSPFHQNGGEEKRIRISRLIYRCAQHQESGYMFLNISHFRYRPVPAGHDSQLCGIGIRRNVIHEKAILSFAKTFLDQHRAMRRSGSRPTSFTWKNESN